MYLEDATKAVEVFWKGCGSVINHLTRGQIHMEVKVVSQVSQSGFNQLRKDIKASLKENQAMKVQRPPSGEYGGGCQMAHETGKELVRDAGGTYDEIGRNRDQSFCCHYCSSGGNVDIFCFEVKEDEAYGLIRMEERNLVSLYGKMFPPNTSRPIITVMAEYSLQEGEERPVVVEKEEESSSTSLNASVGRLRCWASP